MAYDRQKSKDAIDELIKKEREHIKDLKKRIEERKADKLPVDHLEKAVEDEERKINGKEEIRERVDGFSSIGTIDAYITAEQKAVDDGKAELAKLRGKSPKPQDEIDKLDRLVHLLEKQIEGKKEAKGAIV
jgi:hypothetical protein